MTTANVETPEPLRITWDADQRTLRVAAAHLADLPFADFPPVCPNCAGPIAYEYTCHTYGAGTKWYSCLPCDSAIEYSCVRDMAPNPADPDHENDHDGCGWDFTHGLNPGNPRSPANEAKRPSWLVGDPQAGEHGLLLATPGVPYRWDLP